MYVTGLVYAPPLTQIEWSMSSTYSGPPSTLTTNTEDKVRPRESTPQIHMNIYKYLNTSFLEPVLRTLELSEPRALLNK